MAQSNSVHKLKNPVIKALVKPNAADTWQRSDMQRFGEWVEALCFDDGDNAPLRRPPTPQPVESFESVAKARLARLHGVEAAFNSGSGPQRVVIVVAREHGIVSRRELIKIEDELARKFGHVELAVRAHQGRGMRAFEGLKRIF